MQDGRELLVDAETIARSVRRIAASIRSVVSDGMPSPVEARSAGAGVGSPSRSGATNVIEESRGAKDLALVGIRRGGVPLAERLAREVTAVEGREIPVGTIDIALYRDDAATALPDPKIGPSSIPFDVNGRDVVLVDDVLQTGRTIRAAIDCLLDYGRPRRVWLAVLFDRGGRELPIAPDFVGGTLDVAPGVRVDVELDAGAFVRAVPTKERGPA